ncbi:hypothetical protein [Desertivirga xinjiangensis]|uniref:hypothetical protein n=1 Tax=Desertivirga xinjiangensis TaxID=539206 RepID=UPI00210E4A36|nr:hypothetical protein [Pedobacter xinjiangensis]
MRPEEAQLRRKIKAWITFFIIALILSGITAFPIESQLSVVMKFRDRFPLSLQNWLSTIYSAVKTTNTNYPYLAYGTDWLAFAHIVIATAFIGPLRDPLRNIWVIQFGMIACVMIFPLALIAGPIRGIPMFWQLIDCSFGLLGIIPLYVCYRYIKTLESIQVRPLSQTHEYKH